MAEAFTKNWPTVRDKLTYLFNGPRRPSDLDLLEIALKLKTLQGGKFSQHFKNSIFPRITFF